MAQQSYRLTKLAGKFVFSNGAVLTETVLGRLVSSATGRIAAA